MDKKILLLSIVIMILATACTQYQYEPVDVTGDVVTDVEDINTNIEEIQETIEDADNVGEVIDEVEEIQEMTLDEQPDVIAYEGDLIDLNPYVRDPDGDPVELGYTAPFNEEGMWQTEMGDAGFYSVIVTATDNKDSFVTRQMTINVLVRNKPPVINIPKTLEFDEGDLIEIDPDIYDPDGDEVVVIYSGWLNNDKTYQSTYDDAGTYEVTIRADDGKEIVTKDVTVIVNDVNRKPSISFESDARIVGTEGDLVKIEASADDPDGDEVSFMYEEPFDENGEWQTERGDAGTYEIDVTATDGENEVTNEVLVEILKRNQPPVIDSITVTPEEVVLKKPGDQVTIEIDVVASDPDDDELEITYSGYMDSNQKTVEYGEKGGLKVVTVTVSDGQDSVTQDVTFNMNNWPCFNCQ